jgi:hypothetical protein
MNATLEKARIVQSLAGLMERLSAPDLTAAESDVLRPRLYGLLQVIEEKGFDVPSRRAGVTNGRGV